LCTFTQIYVGIFTEGTSRKGAYDMAKDAVETVIEADLDIVIDPLSEENFIVLLSYCTEVVARVLKRIRANAKMTITEVAKEMNSQYANAYAQYEQGKSLPSAEKFAEILTHMNPALEPMLKVGNGQFEKF
jgi:hypothetical protein